MTQSYRQRSARHTHLCATPLNRRCPICNNSWNNRDFRLARPASVIRTTRSRNLGVTAVKVKPLMPHPRSPLREARLTHLKHNLRPDLRTDLTPCSIHLPDQKQSIHAELISHLRLQ